MDKAMFDELLASVQEMDEILRGRRAAARGFDHLEPKVKAVREKTGVSQGHFALLIGVSKRTLENWEQGRRNPTGPARALLEIVDADPQDAVRALHG